jgi:uncharacterized membrane protein YkvA (DUF1232 family)
MAASTRRRAAYTAAAAAVASEGPVGIAQRIGAIPRMVRDVMRGDYAGLGRGRLLLMLGAVLYIVSPIDFLPEALLTIPGLADDAAVATWLVATALGATGAYVAWERGQAPNVDDPRVVDGEIIR